MNPSAPCKVNLDSGIQEFFSCGIRTSKLKESEIPLKIGIRRNPYLESGIYMAESRIQQDGLGLPYVVRNPVSLCRLCN